jgi:ribosome-binding protein aMBF1 (putative translation factor)
MQITDTAARYGRLRQILVDARKSKELTQQELAKRLSRTQSWVCKCEAGTAKIDVIEFLDIASAIGIDPCRLIRDFEATSSTPKRRKSK